MRKLTCALACAVALLVPFAAHAQKKPPSAPTTTVIQGTVTVDPSCDLLGTVVYFPGRSYQARLGFATTTNQSGRPYDTFQIDGVPVNASLTTLTIEVPYASVPAMTVSFTLPTTSVTQVGTINYPGTCGSSGPVAQTCTLNSQCNDNNRCTTDLCTSGKCASTPIVCDDGNADTINSCDPAVGCVFTPNVCGDGVKATTETCDDKNTTSGDGCSSSCQVEPGYNCTGSPSVCASTCGDGVVAATETCDDQNLQDGDGCSSSCQVESGYSCTGSPSVCTPNPGYCSTAADCGTSTVCATYSCVNNACVTSYQPSTFVCQPSTPTSPTKYCNGFGVCQ